MAGDNEFWGQYKHPQWQKKRLETMELADFVCQRCGGEETELNVHHKRYVKGRKIWEYETSELSVLCVDCHQFTHKYKDYLNEILSRLHPEGLEELTPFIAAYCTQVTGPAAVDCSDLIIQMEGNAYAETAGSIAAYAQNSMHIEELVALECALIKKGGKRHG